MIEARQVPMEAARHWLRRAVERGDTSGGRMGLDDVLSGSVAVMLSVDGRDVGALALSFEDVAGGRVCWVNAAGADNVGPSLVPAMHAAVRAIARQNGAGQIAVTTRRRGLIHALRRLGFGMAAVEMRFEI